MNLRGGRMGMEGECAWKLCKYSTQDLSLHNNEKLCLKNRKSDNSNNHISFI